MPESSAVSPRDRVADALGKVWWLPLLRGVLLIVMGGYALLTPGMTLVALTQVLGIFVIVDGILTVMAGLFGETPSRFWTVARGLLEILVGIFVFANPVIVAGISTNVLLYVIAFGAIASGVLEIMAAISDRKELQGEGWLILGGALAILFGVLVLMAPLKFGLAMIQVLGVYAIISGIAMIVFAFRVRRFGKRLGSNS